MDERLKELLHVHRTKFAQIDAERIIPFLRDTGLVSVEDIDVIRRQPSPVQRIHTLLDILPAKGFQAFQTLCLALETTYPHLLTIMLIGASQRMPFYISRQTLTSPLKKFDKRWSASELRH
uniref:CARD domain-containing protein n=1 Tax=Scylla olivacea TaxID=85551 RepID=A0A0P4W5K3_SCYOL